MLNRKFTTPIAASLLAVSASACVTAPPTKKELEYEQQKKSVDLLPATNEARQKIKLQDPVTQATFWSIEYEKSPADPQTAVEFVKALRLMGNEDRAAEIASQALALAPDNIELLSLFGKSLLSAGKATGAIDILRRAHGLNSTDITILGALGVAYDQTGRHREAQATYRKVLAQQPDNTANLSNLGLSLALTGEPEQAEILLRKAVAQSNATARERQNLALVLSVQGKFDEARKLSAADLPDDKVDANIEYFRAMLTPKSRNYTALRGSSD